MLRDVAASMLLLAVGAFAAADEGETPKGCGKQGIAVQVLGSGGPELRGERASTGYVLWKDGRAVALIDAGGGSALRFGQSGARFADLEAVLFTHLHADHSSDFPALVKSGFFQDRQADLPVYGPAGNRLLPAVDRYLQLAFGTEGAYPYLSDMLDGSGRFKLEAVVVAPGDGAIWRAGSGGEGLSVAAVRVEHGPLPALAWRLEVDGKSVTISGDMNGRLGNLEKLAHGTDLLIAHHAIAESSEDAIARRLHMPPSVIGRIAAAAKARRLVLGHIMQRTEGGREANLAAIARHYDGPVGFASDMACYVLE